MKREQGPNSKIELQGKLSEGLVEQLQKNYMKILKTLEAFLTFVTDIFQNSRFEIIAILSNFEVFWSSDQHFGRFII